LIDDLALQRRPAKDDGDEQEYQYGNEMRQSFFQERGIHHVLT
jgi:hypothetical protein